METQKQRIRKSWSELAKTCGEIGVSSVELAYIIATAGLCFFFYYKWFILSVFVSLPTITIPQAIGIALSIRVFRGISYNVSGKKPERLTWIIAPFFILLIGYIAHLFIR